MHSQDLQQAFHYHPPGLVSGFIESIICHVVRDITNILPLEKVITRKVMSVDHSTKIGLVNRKRKAPVADNQDKPTISTRQLPALAPKPATHATSPPAAQRKPLHKRLRVDETL